MCTSPSSWSPISMKAPKSTTFLTVPCSFIPIVKSFNSNIYPKEANSPIICFWWSLVCSLYFFSLAAAITGLPLFIPVSIEPTPPWVINKSHSSTNFSNSSVGIKSNISRFLDSYLVCTAWTITFSLIFFFLQIWKWFSSSIVKSVSFIISLYI
mgnify:CR=1 FL=1